MFDKSSLSFRFSLIVLLSITLAVGALYMLSLDVYKSEVQNRARTVSDNVNDFGAWVSQYGRVWVKGADSGSHLSEQKFVELKNIKPDGEPLSEEDLGKVTSFFSKNPALAQREFSEVVAKSESKAKFRMTSDNYMNPANQPDNFEKEAIRAIKAGNLKEYGEFRETEYRYARTLLVTESCLKCHGESGNAPKDVIDRYGSVNGFGFKAGEVAGIISVRVPVEFSILTLAKGISDKTWIALSLLVLVIVLPILFVRSAVVKPVRVLTEVAEQVSTGQIRDLSDFMIDEKSRNEIHQLALSIKRISTSINIMMSRLRNK